jgi:hypothetical protein
VIATTTFGRLRRVQRRAHLLAAAVLLAYVYAPLGPELQDVVRFAAFPALAVTGIAMWQAARIRRALRSVRATPRPRSHEPNARRKDRDATARDG